MSEVVERAPAVGPAILPGTFRRFTSGGPAYEVVAVHPERASATIRVLESGEELEYPLGKIADDAEA
jgi:hypothetical protein